MLYCPASSLLVLILAWFVLPSANANSYLVINQPTTGVQWSNNAVNPITWTKGLLDGITSVDVELARMNQNGLIYVARDVPASTSAGALNLLIQGVPLGDDYYLLFLNATHGVKYASSQRFSIADTGNGSAPTPAAGAPTVTVSGGPDPTLGFATTFPPAPNGARMNFQSAEGLRVCSIATAVAVCVLGAAWSVL